MSDERNPLDEVDSGVAKARSSLQLTKANRRTSCHCLRWTQENLLAIYAAGNIGCCIFATGDAALRSIGMQAGTRRTRSSKKKSKKRRKMKKEAHQRALLA